MILKDKIDHGGEKGENELTDPNVMSYLMYSINTCIVY